MNHSRRTLIVGAVLGVALAASLAWGFLTTSSLNSQLVSQQQKLQASAQELKEAQDQLKTAQAAAAAASQANADAQACQASLKARDEQLQAFALQAASCETLKRRFSAK